MMTALRKLAAPTLLSALLAVVTLPAAAQDVLPRPEPPFKGKIGRTGFASEANLSSKVVASPQKSARREIGGLPEKSVVF